MTMEELKEQLKPIHKKLNDNLNAQQSLLAEYETLLTQSIELTDSYFQKIKTQFNSSNNINGEKAHE